MTMSCFLTLLAFWLRMEIVLIKLFDSLISVNSTNFSLGNK